MRDIERDVLVVNGQVQIKGVPGSFVRTVEWLVELIENTLGNTLPKVASERYKDFARAILR